MSSGLLLDERQTQTDFKTQISIFIVEKAYVSATGIVFLIVTGKILNTKWILIGLITVFDAILTGRQSGQKLQCLYRNVRLGIRWYITFSKIEFYTICES